MRPMDFFRRFGKGKPRSEPIPKQVTSAVEKSLLGAGVSSIFTANTRLVNEKTVSDKLLKSYQGWVFVNVSTIARSVSRIDLVLYSTKVVAGQIEYDEVSDHPLLDLLGRFNEMTSATDGIYMTQAHLELAGDTFWYIDGVGKAAKNIYLLEPDNVTVKSEVDGEGVHITGYEYKITVDGKSASALYLPEEIIHFKVPNPDNAVRGKSVVEAAATTIDTDTMAEEYTKNLFINGALQKFILSTDKAISEQDMKRLETQMQKNYGGFTNAYKTLILSGGLAPSKISETNRDMEFSLLSQWTRDKITSMFGNNKAVLGITEDVNRANAEATIDNWLKENIKPKMQRLVDTLNEFFIPQFGDQYVLGFEDPAPENRGDAVDEVVSLFANATSHAVMSLNEARERVDLDSTGNAEDDIPPGSADAPDPPAPVAQQLPPDPKEVPKALLNVNLKGHLRRRGVYKEVQRYRDKQALKLTLKETAKGMLRPMVEKKIKAAHNHEHTDKPAARPEAVMRGSKDFTQPELLSYWKKIDYISSSHEKLFRQQVIRFLEQLEVKVMAVVSVVGTKGTKTVAPELFDFDEELTSGIALFVPVVSDIVNLAGEAAYKLVKRKQTEAKSYKPGVTIGNQIREHVEFFVKSILTTDKDRLGKVLAEGVDNGDSNDVISRSIKDTFGDIKKYQSEKVARTETIRASNMAAEDAFKQSGVVEAKEWLTAGDDLVDDECEAFDSDVVELGADFGEGDPPLHPNCRCVIIPVLSDSVDKELRVDNAKLKRQLTRMKKKLDEQAEVNQELSKLIEG